MQHYDEPERQLHCSMLYLQAITPVHQTVGPWAKFNLQKQILIPTSPPPRKVIQEHVKPILSPFDKSTKLTKAYTDIYVNTQQLLFNTTIFCAWRHVSAAHTAIFRPAYNRTGFFMCAPIIICG